MSSFSEMGWLSKSPYAALRHFVPEALRSGLFPLSSHNRTDAAFSMVQVAVKDIGLPIDDIV